MKAVMKALGAPENMIAMKLHYLVFYAGIAPVYPFQTLIARQAGVQDVTVGILFGCFPFLALLTRVLLGPLIDRFQLHKAVLLVTISITGVLPFLLLLISRMGPLPTAKVQLQCTARGGSFSLPRDCPLLGETATFCKMQCELPISSVPPDNTTRTTCSAGCQNMTEVKEVTYLVEALRGLGDSVWVAVEDLSLNAPPKECCLPAPESFFPCSSKVLQCQVTCPYDKDSSPSNPPVHLLSRFWLFAAILCLWNVSEAVVSTLADTICVHMVARPSDFGKQRMWGTLGWGVMVPVAGSLLDILNGSCPIKSYLLSYSLLTAFLAADLLLWVFFIKIPRFPQSQKLAINVLSTFRSPSVLTSLIIFFVSGTGMGAVWQFLFWYAEDLTSEWGDQTHIKLLQGLLLSIECLAEMPCFFLAGHIIRLIGHHAAFFVSLAASGFRFLAYSWLNNAWLLLPIELLHGPAFGIFAASLTSYVHDISPEGAAASMQFIANGIFGSLGTGVGSIVAGVLYGTFGGKRTFWWAGVFIIFSAFSLGAVQLLLVVCARRTQSHRSALEDKKDVCPGIGPESLSAVE